MKKYSEVSGKIFKLSLYERYLKDKKETFTVKSYKFKFKEFVMKSFIITS